jgi:cyclopropane-fatty-acyl-phospholipid synthase
MATSPLTQDRTTAASRSLLEDLTRGYRPRDFAVRFWDGSRWDPEPGHDAAFTLVLNHPGSLRAMFWPPTNRAALGEAYVYDDFDIEGDLHAYFRLSGYLASAPWGLGEKLNFAARLLALPNQKRPRTGLHAARLTVRMHSRERDRQAIAFHYDQSNDFFALWLDRRMVYSCAYFHTPDDDLDAAQEQKLDHICRKLRLKPGERLLDLGCGWGGLAQFAAERYGVEALGVTLSRRQAEWADASVRRAGLQGRCRVEYRDYREVDEPEGFDKVASIGMIEHVGAALQPAYFRRAWRLLKPGGVFLSHGITCGGREVPRARAFAHRYVFPDGELTQVSHTLTAAESAGWEVRDLENLREHYELTLRHWLRRLEARHAEAVRLTDETTYRVFRLYLAGSASGFRSGAYQLHQALLSKPANGASGLPLTRADWYEGHLALRH